MSRFAHTTARTLATALCCLSLNALADVKIGVIASSTGVTAVVSIPQKNTAALLPAEIGGQKVEYIVLDDASDPTNAVTNVKKLLTEHKVDALIGPTTTPAALAMLDFVAEAKVPLVTTVGSSAIVLPMDDKKKWVFKTTQNDDLIAEAVIEHMVAGGIKTLGFIGFNDPYGENWYKVFAPMAEKAGLKIVASERFTRTDQSVIGQALKIIAAKPDAVFIAATGGPAVLPQATLLREFADFGEQRVAPLGRQPVGAGKFAAGEDGSGQGVTPECGGSCCSGRRCSRTLPAVRRRR